MDIRSLQPPLETIEPSVLLADPLTIISNNSLESVRGELRSFLYGDFSQIFANHDHSELLELFKSLQLIAQYFLLQEDVTRANLEELRQQNERLECQVSDLRYKLANSSASPQIDKYAAELASETIYKQHILDEQLYIEQLRHLLNKDKKPFVHQCTQCAKKFDSELHLRMHFERRHSSDEANVTAEERVERQYEEYVSKCQKSGPLSVEAMKAFNYPSHIDGMHVQSDIHSVDSSFTDVLESYDHLNQRLQ